MENYLNNLNLIKSAYEVEKKLLSEIEKYSNHEKQEILKAMEFCKQKHNWQTRDEWVPYYSHPFFVAILWIEQKLDYIDIISLLLHDILEDTDTSSDEIKNIFWYKVFENVYLLSKNYFRSKEEYYKNISENRKLQILKWLDRIANLHSLNFASTQKQENYIEKTKKEILSILDKDLEVYNKIKSILDYLEKKRC